MKDKVKDKVTLQISLLSIFIDKLVTSIINLFGYLFGDNHQLCIMILKYPPWKSSIILPRYKG